MAGGRLGPRFDRRRGPAAAGGGPADDSDPARASIARAAVGWRRRLGGGPADVSAAESGGRPADDSDPASIAAVGRRQRIGAGLARMTRAAVGSKLCILCIKVYLFQACGPSAKQGVGMWGR